MQNLDKIQGYLLLYTYFFFTFGNSPLNALIPSICKHLMFHSLPIFNLSPLHSALVQTTDYGHPERK